MGMLGGVGVLLTLTLISNSISKYGVTAILEKVVEKMNEDGISIQEIKSKIDSYFITKELKLKLYYLLDNIEKEKK